LIWMRVGGWVSGIGYDQPKAFDRCRSISDHNTRGHTRTGGTHGKFLGDNKSVAASFGGRTFAHHPPRFLPPIFLGRARAPDTIWVLRLAPCALLKLPSLQGEYVLPPAALFVLREVAGLGLDVKARYLVGPWGVGYRVAEESQSSNRSNDQKPPAPCLALAEESEGLLLCGSGAPASGGFFPWSPQLAHTQTPGRL
jgi:hypothetical protein